MSRTVVLRSGTVIDPANKIFGKSDVRVAAGKIVAVGPDLDIAADDDVFDVPGKYVVPGLIDVHAHTFWGVGDAGVSADRDCLPFGVTTIVDAGSCGSTNYPGFREYVQRRSRTRVLALINVSFIGQIGGGRIGELLHDEWLDMKGAASVVRDNPDDVVGYKIRIDSKALGERGVAILRRVKDGMRDCPKPLMVHICNSGNSLVSLLPLLERGDIITHMMTTKGQATLRRDGKILPEVWEARERGIVFDIGHGRSHFSWAEAEAMMREGFYPDTISTDLTAGSLAGPVGSLLATMNKHLLLGMPIEAVIRAVTSRAAEAIGYAGTIGELTPGSVANVAVLEFGSEPTTLTDTSGLIRVMEKPLRCAMVFKDGLPV